MAGEFKTEKGAISRIAIAIAILAICLAGVSGSKEDKDKSKKVCEKPKQFAYELDYDWVMAQSKWYFPLMSKQDLVRQSSDILEESLEKVQEDKGLAGQACMHATWEGLTPTISGFNGKRTSYNLSPSDWTNFNILGWEKAWDKGQSGELYITHTDNKQFVFFVRCWEDGERTWTVMTTVKKLSKDGRKTILDHAKLMGFSPDDLEEIDYEQCGQKKTEL